MKWLVVNQWVAILTVTVFSNAAVIVINQSQSTNSMDRILEFNPAYIAVRRLARTNIWGQPSRSVAVPKYLS
jgi:hypothetical protein